MLEIDGMQCQVSIFRDIRSESGAPLPLGIRLLIESEKGQALHDLTQLALLDTGSEFTILNTQFAHDIHILPFNDESPGDVAVSSRHGLIYGRLVPCIFTLEASEGQDISWHGEAWVSVNWPGPTIIGWKGALENLRFHIDPEMCLGAFSRL